MSLAEDGSSEIYCVSYGFLSAQMASLVNSRSFMKEMKSRSHRLFQKAKGEGIISNNITRHCYIDVRKSEANILQNVVTRIALKSLNFT